jgi:hypothetical protein
MCNSIDAVFLGIRTTFKIIKETVLLYLSWFERLLKFQGCIYVVLIPLETYVGIGAFQ